VLKYKTDHLPRARHEREGREGGSSLVARPEVCCEGCGASTRCVITGGRGRVTVTMRAESRIGSVLEGIVDWKASRSRWRGGG
jgi:hypothetical protein